jgi:hypothetical protein
MKKKLFFALVLGTAFFTTANAQTNLQIFYDFGKDRKIVTTTLEGFYNDNWGNTFFFIDYDYAPRSEFPNGTYFEIARCLNFWQDSPLAPLSLQVEYNGGVYNKYGINHAFLTGIDWFLHSGDFRNTLNFKLLYKHIVNVYQKVPMQFTTVWGCQDIFGAKGLRFSGFVDVWNEGNLAIVLSEPQLWYSFGTEHFNLGGEVELGYNFGGATGFTINPCLGMKWVF